jgi:hypothetical protein
MILQPDQFALKSFAQPNWLAKIEQWLGVVAALESIRTTNLQRVVRLRQTILHQTLEGELI